MSTSFILAQIYQAIDSLSHTVDSLSAVVKHNENAHQLTAVIIPVAAALLASALTGLIQFQLRKKNRQDDQRKADREYAAVWGAVMKELELALGAMNTQASDLMAIRDRIGERGDASAAIPVRNELEIELVDGLRLKYLSVSRHPNASDLILPIYVSVLHYRESYRKLLQSPRPQPWTNTAIRIVQQGSYPMAQGFNECLRLFKNFLEDTGQTFDHHIDKVEPIPDKWRTDKSSQASK